MSGVLPDGLPGATRHATDALRRSLAADAAEWYRPSGFFARRWARGKLDGDPAYIGILEHGWIADGARVLDLGCGQGVTLAWLLAARARYDAGGWAAPCAMPPRLRSFAGVELMANDVERARAAFGDRGSFVTGDIRHVGFEPCDVAMILDVLHYMNDDDQARVLERVRDALQAAHGTLLLRIGDAGAGLPFEVSRFVDHAVTFARGHRLSKLHCRPLDAWCALLHSLGFAVEARPMSQGTPFANVLLFGRL